MLSLVSYLYHFVYSSSRPFFFLFFSVFGWIGCFLFHFAFGGFLPVALHYFRGVRRQLSAASLPVRAAEELESSLFLPPVTFLLLLLKFSSAATCCVTVYVLHDTAYLPRDTAYLLRDTAYLPHDTAYVLETQCTCW